MSINPYEPPFELNRPGPEQGGSGPYSYKIVNVDIGTFQSVKKGIRRIQETVDRYVDDGWELYRFEPVPMGFVWRWNVVVFRRASGRA